MQVAVIMSLYCLPVQSKKVDDSSCHYHASFCLDPVPFTVEVDSNEDNLVYKEPKFTSVGDLFLI